MRIMKTFNFDWHLAPIFRGLSSGMRGDMFTYCEHCGYRSHFQVDKSYDNKHICKCHHCGFVFSRKLLFPLPAEWSK